MISTLPVEVNYKTIREDVTARVCIIRGQHMGTRAMNPRCIVVIIMPSYKDPNLAAQSQRLAQMLCCVHMGNDPSTHATFVHISMEHIHVKQKV